MCAGHWGKYFGCFHHQLILKFIGSQWAEPIVVFVRRTFCYLLLISFRLICSNFLLDEIKFFSFRIVRRNLNEITEKFEFPFDENLNTLFQAPMFLLL
jgi:thymidine kinase